MTFPTLVSSKKPRYWAVEQGETLIAGRINKNYEIWKEELEASPFVLNIVKNGYTLPFTCNPPPCSLKNNRSSQRNRSFVESSIFELLKNKCIEEVNEPPFCINPLSVAEGKKLRLVLDLRHVNKYL